MATTKSKETNTKKTTEETIVSSADLKSIQAFMESMKKEIEDLKKENEELKESQQENGNNYSQPRVVNFAPIANQTNNLVRIVHLQECLGGLTTHIELSNTTRDLKKIGDIMNISLGDFEELIGKYSKFFDNGILAVDASCMKIAEEYNLPIYDKETKAKYNSKILNQTGDMTNEELGDFYNSLSYSAQSHFLSYWLSKCYIKDKKYYDREKLAYLDKISDTDTFINLIFEINNNESRQRKGSTIKVDI